MPAGAGPVAASLLGEAPLAVAPPAAMAVRTTFLRRANWARDAHALR